jgi:hypothetical protein
MQETGLEVRNSLNILAYGDESGALAETDSGIFDRQLSSAREPLLDLKASRLAAPPDVFDRLRYVLGNLRIHGVAPW